MARLRTLNIGTEKIGDVEHDRCILILDHLTYEQGESISQLDRHPDVPPILAFDFPVELPGGQKPNNVVLDINHADDADMKNLLRKMARADAAERPAFS